MTMRECFRMCAHGPPRSSDGRRDRANRLPRQLYLSYEIPEWDGDMWRRSSYVALSPATAHRKAELLTKHFPSQVARDWWDDETFLGLGRLRGVECRALCAEAFDCAEALLSWT
jgi:hypothetical protein